MESSKTYKVQITITEIMGTGRCSQGFKVGDIWLFEKNITPNNFCASAFHSVYPLVKLLYYGLRIPWRMDDSPLYITCPDAHNPVVYELKRLPSK